MPEETPPAVPGIAVARNVHYVGPDGDHLAALIAQVNNRQKGLCNLTVFAGDRAEETESGACRLIVNVPYSAEPRHLTWHFPERIE